MRALFGVSCYSSSEIFVSISCTSSRTKCKAVLQKINAVGFENNSRFAVGISLLTHCFLTRNWLDQMTTTNRIISSQALIIIRSKRNTFIIRN